MHWDYLSNYGRSTCLVTPISEWPGTQLDAFIISALKFSHPHGDIVVFPQSVVLVGFLQLLLMQDLINLSYFVPWWQ